MFYSVAPSFEGFNPMPRANGATQPPAVHGCGLMAMQKNMLGVNCKSMEHCGMTYLDSFRF